MTDPDFDGKTYNPKRDKERLKGQLKRVYDVLLRHKGQWISIPEIIAVTGDRCTQSISARIRDLRKDKFGGFNVENRCVSRGNWEYRLL